MLTEYKGKSMFQSPDDLIAESHFRKVAKIDSTFQSPDDLIAESHFRKVAKIDSKSLTIIVTIEILVDKV